MRRFHLARAAILARVAGFGKSVVTLLGLWIARCLQEVCVGFFHRWIFYGGSVHRNDTNCRATFAMLSASASAVEETAAAAE